MIKIKDFVPRLKYKPGWSFDYEYHGGYDYHTLTINAQVQHSESGEPVKFAIRRLVPRCAQTTKKAFLSWVEDMLAEAEIHEMREFFRFDGELVDDPHESEPID